MAVDCGRMSKIETENRRKVQIVKNFFSITEAALPLSTEPNLILQRSYILPGTENASVVVQRARAVYMQRPALAVSPTYTRLPGKTLYPKIIAQLPKNRVFRETLDRV